MNSYCGAQLAKQPCARERPSTLEGRGRDSKDRRGFVDAQPDEIAKLDDAGLFGVELFEPHERLVERRQHRILGGGPDQRLGEGHAVHASPALLRAARPRAFDENLAHRARRNADEMLVIGPRRATAGQSKISFVDQRGRL